MGLAPILVKDIFSIIKECNKDGVTILLVEQNANMALLISDMRHMFLKLDSIIRVEMQKN